VRCGPSFPRIDFGLAGRALIAAYHGSTIDTPMVSPMLDRGMLAMDDLLHDLPMKRLGHGEEIADAGARRRALSR
jgi:NAD(P)-dependent dehydrogenase (short-subunit alcohol dehydrogenase family)